MPSDKPIGSTNSYIVPVATIPLTVANSTGKSIAVLSGQKRMLLLDLPPQPLGHMLGFLDYRDIKAAAQTCSSLYSIIRTEHLLARSWFKQFSEKKQQHFVQIANNISHHELKAWLEHFTRNKTLISHTCGHSAGEITDDGLSEREPQQGKYFPQILFYTMGRLMANCPAFYPQLVTSISCRHFSSCSTRLSHDGRYLATNLYTLLSGTGIHERRENTKRPAGITIPHKEWFINEITFSNDNQHILSRTEKTATVTSCNADGSWTKKLTIHAERSVRSATFNPDSRQAVVACDCKAIVCSMDKSGGWAVTGTIIQEKDIWSAQFNPDSSLIVTASNDHTARIHSLNGQSLEQITLEHDGKVRHAGFSPDGKNIMTISDIDDRHCDQIVTIFSANIDTGWNNKKVITHLGGINQVAFSIDNRHAVTASSDHTAVILSCDDTHDNWQVSTTINHSDSVLSAYFGPYCHYLVTASEDKTAKIYRYNAGTRRWAQLKVIVHNQPITSATFSPDSEHILTVSANRQEKSIPGHIAMIHTRTTSDNWIPSADFAPEGGVHQARFNHDGSHIVINARNDRVALIYGYTAEGRWLPKLNLHHQYKLNSATFSPTSDYLMCISDDLFTFNNNPQLVQIWHLYRPDLVPPEHESPKSV
ncbi:F-box/WD40 repeat-containing protein [Endozoicomonas sp. ONNA2]|uniref:F-box/WD repeat-containing protein n=1 Tax=Endozoicomonas sp. ONNA2 TaxID=2828741 RepID=UPI0021499441|nr:F-box/WD40 repeat-containing protein [Endozoicomonas sp. ONNA2]